MPRTLHIEHSTAHDPHTLIMYNAYFGFASHLLRLKPCIAASHSITRDTGVSAWFVDHLLGMQKYLLQHTPVSQTVSRPYEKPAECWSPAKLTLHLVFFPIFSSSCCFFWFSWLMLFFPGLMKQGTHTNVATALPIAAVIITWHVRKP